MRNILRVWVWWTLRFKVLICEHADVRLYVGAPLPLANQGATKSHRRPTGTAVRWFKVIP